MTARAIAFRRFELEEGTAFDAEKVEMRIFTAVEITS